MNLKPCFTVGESRTTIDLVDTDRGEAGLVVTVAYFPNTPYVDYQVLAKRVQQILAEELLK